MIEHEDFKSKSLYSEKAKSVSDISSLDSAMALSMSEAGMKDD